jgi:hypothetical protein
VAPLLLIPIYHRRNVRWVRPATVSNRVFADLSRLPPGTRELTLYDADDERYSIRSSFGSLLPEAVHLATNGRVNRVRLRGPGSGLEPPDGGVPDPAGSAQAFRLCGMRLVPAHRRCGSELASPGN